MQRLPHAWARHNFCDLTAAADLLLFAHHHFAVKTVGAEQFSGVLDNDQALKASNTVTRINYLTAAGALHPGT